eukprot:4917819-Pyramimonas_sp.AAC.1
MTRLVCKLYTNAPGEARRAVRALEKGKVIGPTVGPAIRCTTIYGDVVSVPVKDHWTEGAPELWLNILGPSPRTPPRGAATGDGWGTMFALPVVKGLSHTPVHVVEEALTTTARTNYFEVPLGRRYIGARNNDHASGRKFSMSGLPRTALIPRPTRSRRRRSRG